MAGHPGDVRDERRDSASAVVTDLFRCHHLELVRLALLMTGDQPPSPLLRTGYRLLDVTVPGGDLLAAAGPVVRLRPNPGHDIPAAFWRRWQGFPTSTASARAGDRCGATPPGEYVNWA